MISLLAEAGINGLLGGGGERVDLVASPPWPYGKNSKNTGTKTRRCRLPLPACGGGCVASRAADYARRSSRHSFAQTWRRLSIISRGRNLQSSRSDSRLRSRKRKRS